MGTMADRLRPSEVVAFSSCPWKQAVVTSILAIVVQRKQSSKLELEGMLGAGGHVRCDAPKSEAARQAARKAARQAARKAARQAARKAVGDKTLK